MEVENNTAKLEELKNELKEIKLDVYNTAENKIIEELTQKIQLQVNMLEELKGMLSGQIATPQPTAPAPAAPQQPPGAPASPGIIPPGTFDVAQSETSPFVPTMRINLANREFLAATRRERTLLQRVANNLKRIKGKVRGNRIDEEGVKQIEETARKAAQELEEFEDQEILRRYPAEGVHKKSGIINRRVSVIIRYLRARLKGIKVMTRAAAELERLEEERTRALGEAAESPAAEEAIAPAPPIPSAVPQLPPDTNAFLNDLYTALRSKTWGRVHTMLDFALNQSRLGQKILEVGQISFLNNLLGSLENNNLGRASDILSALSAKEVFRQNPDILEELKRIVVELRARSPEA